MSKVPIDTSEITVINVLEAPSASSIVRKDNRVREYINLIKANVSSYSKQDDTTGILSQSESSIDGGNSPINTLLENNKKALINKINIPRYSSVKPPFPNSFYVELREYNGRVISIDADGKFVAELVNFADSDDILEAEFDTTDIDKGDMPLLKQGALFIWKIGKEESNGTQQRISQIVFRRLSSWRTIDIKRMEEIGKNRAAAIRALITNGTSSI